MLSLANLDYPTVIDRDARSQSNLLQFLGVSGSDSESAAFDPPLL